jgi:hypothetical protein
MQNTEEQLALSFRYKNTTSWHRPHRQRVEHSQKQLKSFYTAQLRLEILGNKLGHNLLK